MQETKPEIAEGRTGRSPELWSEKKARQVLRELDQSGESVAHFARRHGWTPQRLHFWMSKLGWKRSSPVKGTTTPVPAFLPVRVVQRPRPVAGTHPVGEASGVTIELGQGQHILVERTFDEQVLRRVVKVLREEVPC